MIQDIIKCIPFFKKKYKTEKTKGTNFYESNVEHEGNYERYFKNTVNGNIVDTTYGKVNGSVNESTRGPAIRNSSNCNGNSPTYEYDAISYAASGSSDSDAKGSAHENNDYPESKFKRCFKKENNKYRYGKKSDKSQDSEVTRVILNNCNKIRIGPETTNIQTNHIYGGCKGPGSCKRSNKASKTKPEKNYTTDSVRGLCKRKTLITSVQYCYLQYLAQYLKSEWKSLGKAIGFSDGDLNDIEEKDSEDEERAYQMLKQWCQNYEAKKGRAVSYGRLCRELWRSNIEAAQEAVKRLSANKDLD